MRNKKILLGYLLIIHVTVLAQQPGLIRLTEEKLHARVREWPYPANGITVPTNAPALMWPATNGNTVVLPMESGSEIPNDPNIGNVLYKVQLATDKNFTQNLISSEAQAWAVYPLHQALKPGRWFWKYGYSLKGSGKWVWSAVYDFIIDKKYAANKVSPSAEIVLKRNENARPHLWNLGRIKETFYSNNLQNPEAKKFIAFAEKQMKEALPTESPMRDIDTAGKPQSQMSNLLDRMYHGFGDKVGVPVRNLCIAYYLTKDPRFIEDAKRRAINLAHMDADKHYATRDDFNNGGVLEGMGWLYDMGYDFLSADEKNLLKTSMVKRAKEIYDHLPNRFELHVSDNHVWQITLRNLAIATVALVGDVPEAKEWFTYMYEVWSARFPVLGTTDGAWHEGNGYFLVNFRSVIYLSQLFSDFSGVDYFQLPWMQNLPYYLLYTFPPDGTTMAYGDQWENLRGGINNAFAQFASALTFKINNPYLNWYVAQIKDTHPNFFQGTDDYLFFRLLNYQPSRKLELSSPESLPQLWAFRDVGFAAMTDEKAKTGKGIFSYLISNSFGSSGHGHAGQNAFNINYKGKVIFGNTGYYSNFSDRHNLLHYRNTRAYNTILADSLSQAIGEEGYGWIARTISGQKIQYALGDASNAYGNIKSIFWKDRFEKNNLQPDLAHGFGDPGVTLYRRHMLQLEGGYIVLYDELEAKKPIKWTSQFHVPFYKIVAEKTDNASRQNFSVVTDLGEVFASVFGYTPLQMTVHDRFAEPAVNWMKLTDGDKLRDYKNQWHAGITSLEAKKYRFLTIIQIKDGVVQTINQKMTKDGLLNAGFGTWVVHAQLDGNKPAALQITNVSLKTAFSYGNGPLTLQGKTYKQKKEGSSMLVEQVSGKVNVQEVTDELPDVAKYDRPE